MARRTQLEIWRDTFSPIKNDLAPKASDDGTVFQISGAQLERVEAALAANPDTVWTLVDADGKLYVTQGHHYVNRMGYFITDKPFDRSNPVHVKRYQSKDVVY